MKKIPYDAIKKGKINQRSYVRFLNISNYFLSALKQIYITLLVTFFPSCMTL